MLRGNKEAGDYFHAQQNSRAQRSTNQADVNAKDKYGRTALMEAAYWGYVDAVKMLIEAGADIDAKSDQGMTALDFASKKAAEVLRSSARGR